MEQKTDTDPSSYECTACGAEVALEDEKCPNCGADISELDEDVVLESEKSAGTAADGDYLVIPFIGKIKGGFFSSENAETVSRQLQSLINQYSRQGWEFHNIAKVDIEVTPGCLASLFGAKTSYITFDQVVFRRSRP
jgi:hypothetical protein